MGNAQGTNPRLDLDHIIIWTEKDAPQVKSFEEKGFSISPTIMVHTRIGTGGRYINFYNVYLEFLYPTEQATLDPKFDKTLSPARDKWQESGESPFGVGLSMTPYDTTTFPFEGKLVQAPWMRPNTGVYFASSNIKDRYEPMVLIVPPHMARPKGKAETREDIKKKVLDEERRKQAEKSFQHAIGIETLTGLKITCTTKELSSTIKALKNVKNCQIVKGKEHLMEMTFDGNRQKKTADFRPQLPVVIHY